MLRFLFITILICTILGGIIQQTVAETAGAVADNLGISVDFLRHIFASSSEFLGVIFLVTTVFKYFRFRENAHETPLSSVFIFLILGIVLLILPLSYQLAHYLSVKNNVDNIFPTTND